MPSQRPKQSLAEAIEECPLDECHKHGLTEFTIPTPAALSTCIKCLRHEVKQRSKDENFVAEVKAKYLPYLMSRQRSRNDRNRRNAT